MNSKSQTESVFSAVSRTIYTRRSHQRIPPHAKTRIAEGVFVRGKTCGWENYCKPSLFKKVGQEVGERI